MYLVKSKETEVDLLDVITYTIKLYSFIGYWYMHRYSDHYNLMESPGLKKIPV